MSIEGTANTEYASLSGKIRTFVVDKTLTISGACADAKATGDAIETKAGEAAKDAVSEQLPAAVTAGVIAELPKFLDDTLTTTDKAAPADVVGARLDKLDAQYTIEKIVEVVLDEGILPAANGGTGFYIELPKTMSHYPLLMIRCVNLCTHPDFDSNNSKPSVLIVESLAGDIPRKQLTPAMYCNHTPPLNRVDVFYPFELSPGEMKISDMSWGGNAVLTDTKHLFVDSGSGGFAAGARFEIWGATT